MPNHPPSRSEFFILSGLGLLVLAVVCLLIRVGFVQPGSEHAPFIRTSHSNNVDGVRVLHELLLRLGYPVQRSEVPLSDRALTDADVLWVLDPILPLNPAEIGAVHDWLRAGRRLIVSGSARLLIDDLVPATNSGATEPDASPRLGPAGSSSGPLGPNVDRVETSAPDEQWRSWLNRRTDCCMVLFQEENEAHPFIVSFRVGRGEAIVLADTRFLSNGSIGLADHAVLAANLVAYATAGADGRRVMFDEYHFGFGARETGWTLMNRMLWQTSAGWSVLACAAAGMLFLIYRGRHFGVRRDPETRSRRSRMEFVAAAAAAMRRAGAHRLAFRLNYDDWLRTQRRRLGLTSVASVDDIAGQLARRTAGSAAWYAEFLQRCEEAAYGDGPPSPLTFHPLYRRMAEIESDPSRK